MTISVPYCRALLPLGLWWLAAMAQLGLLGSSPHHQHPHYGRRSRPCIQSISRLPFWESPLGKHPRPCEELPCCCLVIWPRSGRDSLCLAQ